MCWILVDSDEIAITSSLLWFIAIIWLGLKISPWFHYIFPSLVNFFNSISKWGLWIELDHFFKTNWIELWFFNSGFSLDQWWAHPKSMLFIIIWALALDLNSTLLGHLATHLVVESSSATKEVEVSSAEIAQWLQNRDFLSLIFLWCFIFWCFKFPNWFNISFVLTIWMQCIISFSRFSCGSIISSWIHMTKWF